MRSLCFAVLAVAVVLAGLSGCAANFKITSNPPGARVLIDGKDTGQKTPALIHPRALDGEHTVAVTAEGYDPVPPRKAVGDTSVGLVVWSIVGIPTAMWWIPITNLARGHVKVDPTAMHFDLRQTDFARPAPAAPSASLTVVIDRKKLRNQVKCATLPMRTSGISGAIVSVADELLLGELQMSGFESIGRDDMNALLDFDKQKSALDCSDAACIAEIGNALGVPYLVTGNIARVEDNTVVTLKVIDVRQSKVLTRTNKMSAGKDEAVPQLLAEAVQAIVASSGL
jgi:hypothetical protein